MKYIGITFIAILMACGSATTQAQDVYGAQSGIEIVSSQVIPDKAPIDPADPKANATQKAELLGAGADNPSRPNIEADPRSQDYNVNPETYCGDRNAKPSAGLLNEPSKEDVERVKASNTASASQPHLPGKMEQSSDSGQPMGQKPLKVENFREIKAPDDQPLPAIKANVINYRDIKGPNDQPKPIAPGK